MITKFILVTLHHQCFKFQVQFISNIQVKILFTMIIKVKAAHGEEAHKETTGLIYYESPQYR